jgi:hypothetical protein
MANIKINDLQATDMEFVELTDAEMAEINGGFRKLFASASRNSGSNSSQFPGDISNLSGGAANLLRIGGSLLGTVG